MRLAAVVAVAAALSVACQARVAVEVEVADDGSGTVSVALGLDAAALTQVGSPGPILSDLVEAGWTASAVETSTDGLRWVQVSKPFSDPDDFDRVAAELAGGAGPLRELRLSQSGTLLRRVTTFSGAVDLTQGVTGLVDPGVVAAAGEVPLGLDLEGLRSRFGDDLSETLDLEVAVSIPGASRRWQAPMGQLTPLSLEATGWRVVPAVPAAASIGFAMLGVAVATSGRRRRRRRKRRASRGGRA